VSQTHKILDKMIHMVKNMPSQKFEQLKITSEAKDMLYAKKNRGETYSEALIRIIKEYDDLIKKVR